MRHADHLDLIRAGAEGGGGRWLELGPGDGAFTLALADILRAGQITAMDRDRRAVADLARRVGDAFPATSLQVVVGDFTDGLPTGPFDGVLAANSLHFTADLGPVLRAIHGALVPGGRLLVVEYDADRGNAWVPHPFSFGRWTAIARAAGFIEPRLLHRVPSRFLDAIYGSVATKSAVVHSAPHGGDREE